MSKLIKKIKIDTTITLITGLHIGGSKDNVEIGGIDNPVIKIAYKNGQPYIPGSSLKGKMRCLLEQTKGCVLGGSTEVNNVFGSTDANSPKASRLIVRDAMLTKESEEALSKCHGLDMPYTENKSENTIDRVTGVTKEGGIRQTERVPAGAEFDAEFILNVFEDEDEKTLEDEKALVEMLKQGIALLESDYLGGSGSRGYGQVKFGPIDWNNLQVLDESNGWGSRRSNK